MNLERRADLLLVVTTVLAASGWVMTKEAMHELPPFGFIGWRFLLASLCLLPFCYREFAQVTRKDMAKGMAVGVVLSAAILLWAFAVSISDTLGEGAFILSLSMLFVPLVAWFMFGNRPASVFWLSLPIAAMGLMLLSLGGGDGWQTSPTQLLFLGAAIMLAIHFNLNSKYARRIPTLLLTCLQLFSIGIVGISLSFFTEDWPAAVSSVTWGWFVASMLLATSLRFVLQTKAQKHSSAANAAIIMILEPVWTVFLSVIWYAEEMPAYKVLGCMLILVALLSYRGGPVLARRLGWAS